MLLSSDFNFSAIYGANGADCAQRARSLGGAFYNASSRQPFPFQLASRLITSDGYYNIHLIPTWSRLVSSRGGLVDGIFYHVREKLLLKQ